MNMLTVLDENDRRDGCPAFEPSLRGPQLLGERRPSLTHFPAPSLKDM
jgi:hypothetical protein